MFRKQKTYPPETKAVTQVPSFSKRKKKDTGAFNSFFLKKLFLHHHKSTTLFPFHPEHQQKLGLQDHAQVTTSCCYHHYRPSLGSIAAAPCWQHCPAFFHRRSRRARRGVAERALGLALAVREVASRRRPLQRAAKAGLAHHAPQPFVDAHHQLDLALVVVGRRGRVGRPAPRTRAWGGEMAVSWEALRLTSIVEQRGAA